MIDFIFIFILLIHYLADFALQTHEQAINKSKDIKYLFYHIGVYCLVWFIALLATHDYTGFTMREIGLFTGITFVAHFATDYATSRIGKPFWAKQDLHNGFVVVGFDQILHYLQLYYTFKFLI